MVTFPNKKHRLLMVKLKYQFSRSITSLLSLTLVSAVLMLGSPAFAHELSGSTCGADVVFLWNNGSLRHCTEHDYLGMREEQLFLAGKPPGYDTPRPPPCGLSPPWSTYFKEGANDGNRPIHCFGGPKVNF